MSDNKLNFIQVGGLTYNIGGTGTTSGYPIKIIDTSETGVCTADPNVFYKIKHSGGFMLTFASEAEYYNQSGDFAVFTAETTDESLSELVLMLTFGGLLVEDTSIEGYSYKMMICFEGVEGPVYFSSNPNENSTCMIGVPNIYLNDEIILPSFTTELYNITRLNNQGFIYSVTFMGVSINTWFILTEVTTEGKYVYIPTNPILQQFISVFTDVPIEDATKIYVQDLFVEMLGVSEIPITKRPSYKEVTETCEYVFEINTPCELQTMHGFYWNNDSIPDLTLPGLLTVSIIGGHACYTFKPM